jgi:hypothetical protein
LKNDWGENPKMNAHNSDSSQTHAGIFTRKPEAPNAKLSPPTMMQSSLTLLLGTMVLFSGFAMIESFVPFGKLHDVARTSRQLRVIGKSIRTQERVTITTPVEDTTVNDAAAAVALEDVALIPQVAAAEVTMEEDEEVMFEIDYYNEYPIARSLLEQRQPNSVLTHNMTEQWKERPSTRVVLTDVNKDYFPFVLEYIRNESVQLPSSMYKDYFISEMISLKISFDPAKVESLYRPSVMAQAVLANKQQLQCFKALVIDKGLTKQVEDANNKLDAAKFAHSIVTRYTTEHSLRVECDSTVGKDLCGRFRNNYGFRAYCNSFLEKFGLEAKAVYGYPSVLELSLKLEDN